MQRLEHPELPFVIEVEAVSGRCIKRSLTDGSAEPASGSEYLLALILIRLSKLEGLIESVKTSIEGSNEQSRERERGQDKPASRKRSVDLK